MRSMAYAGLLGAALMLPSTALAKAPNDAPLRFIMAYKERVAAATVTLPERSCAGSVAGTRLQVVTAAHCVNEGATHVLVKLRSGEQRSSEVVYLDRDQDLALLRLSKEVSVEPLLLSDRLPQPGDEVLFVGRVDRPSRTQVAKVEKLGTCPSLPEVSDAVFTTLQAKRGDSGAPLVDESMRVVGVIHGGAQCHIAAPTAPLATLSLDQHGPVVTPKPSVPPPSVSPPPADDDDVALEQKKLGPFVWERTPNGFRFKMNFSWQWSSDDKQ